MNTIRKIYSRIYQQAFHLAIPFLPYREPKILENMKQIAQLLKKNGRQTVLIVTDKGISSLGLTEGLQKELRKADISYFIYDDTVANPTTQNVEDARKMFLDNDCEAIIAFGGGSSMDCAKACGARVVKPKQSVNQMGGLLKIHHPLPLLIAVPTTAGTGSETTLAAVITDAQTHHKYPVNDFVLIPNYAVLDYTVTLGLPKPVTATTGMDALTHAVEAYIGHSTTRYTRQMSEEAAILIHRYLKRAYDNGNDAEARRQMLHASYCAGAAFTRSYVGYCHGIAHSLGGQYSTPHGLANAVILPYILEAYGETCHKPLAKLARVADIASGKDSDELAAAKFIQWIRDMNEAMGIPEYIDGIQEKDIPSMARHADKESNPLYPVPKLMNRKELEQMYYIVGNL